MKMLARAGAIVSALLLAACLPQAAHAQQTGLTITAPAGTVPSQAIYCDNGSGVTALCSFGSTSPVTPAPTSAAVSCQVAKASAGTLFAATLYSSVSGWFLIFNATSAPADGAVTPIEFLRYPTADVTMGYTASPGLTASTGIVICFSTTGPYTKTASATATISSKVQ